VKKETKNLVLHFNLETQIILRVGILYSCVSFFELE